MSFLFDICCGVFWIATYIAAIILGFQKRTWCIPPISICMNLSWELLIVITRLQSGLVFSASFMIQLIWCLLDFGILLTWQLFRARQKHTCIKDLLLFVSILVAVFIVTRMFDNWAPLAFLMNLIMSIEFIIRLNRDTTKWPSLFIALTKLAGTLSATILNGVLYKNLLILGMGGLCLILDIYYLILLLSSNTPKCSKVKK